MRAEEGNYVGAGLTFRGGDTHLYGSARASGGLDFTAESPDWGEISGLAGGEVPVANTLFLGLAASAFLLGYSGPSDYSAWGVLAQPSLRLSLGPVGLLGQWRGWLGRTTVRARGSGGSPPGTPRQVVRSDLELREGSFDGWVFAGPVAVGAGGEVSWLEGSRYASGRVWASGRPTDRSEVVASLLVRDGLSGTDAEAETGFFASASYDLDRNVTVQAILARPLTDLLLGAPQTLAAGISVRFRIGRVGEPPASLLEGANPIVEVLDGETEGGASRRVRFTLPITADSVSLVGDFTGWEARPMRAARGGAWVLETDLAPGVYRYAFLVDGEWHVPPEAPGQVDDGFGQKNLVVVIPAE